MPPKRGTPEYDSWRSSPAYEKYVEFHRQEARSPNFRLREASKKETNRRRGKSIEEIYGPERSEIERRKRSEGNKSFGSRPWGKPPRIPKGQTYEERYGDRANSEKEKRGRSIRLFYETRSIQRGLPPVDPNEFQGSSERYYYWRFLVLFRDGRRCQMCSQSQARMTSHHLKSWREYPDLRYVVSNGVCLCVECHKLVHRYLRRNIDLLGATK